MHDVIIIGGSYAGLSAGLQLARARRRVLVVDAGVRRNRFAASSHGFLTQDGSDPAAIARAAREQLLAYSTVTWLEDTAVSGRTLDAGFLIELASGGTHEAKRLILASGIVDDLPKIPGVAERWGRGIFHCPYCHGYELEQGRIGVLAVAPHSIHLALMLPDWGATTYFTQGLFEPSDEERALLDARGVKIERTAITAVEGHEPQLQVRLADGRTPEFRGLFLAAPTRVASPLPAQLGCAFEEGPVGSYVKTDAMKETTVPGVFACGDMALAAGSVAFAVGDGARAGVSAHRSLIFS